MDYERKKLVDNILNEESEVFNMKKIKGFIEIIVAWFLIKITIGGITGAGIGTHSTIVEHGTTGGVLFGLGFSWAIVAVVALVLIVIIKKLISSGINNFRS